MLVRRLALDFCESDHRGFGSTTDTIALPKPEPRTLRKHFVVLSICSREIICVQRSGIRHGKDMLQPLDFSDGAVGVHPSSII